MTKKFDELPFPERLGIMNQAVNAVLDAPATPETLPYRYAVTAAREALFLERQGVDPEIAKQIAERFMAEGFRMGALAAGQVVEADVRSAALAFDPETLMDVREG